MKIFLLTILISLIALVGFAEEEDKFKNVDGYWSDGAIYSVWKNGEFDLSNTQGLRMLFPKSQKGIKFCVRLLPERTDAEQPVGLSSKIYVIPETGIVIVPISDFRLGKERLKKIRQISVHSGTAAWYHALVSNPESPAVFEKIEMIDEKEDSEKDKKRQKEERYLY